MANKKGEKSDLKGWELGKYHTRNSGGGGRRSKLWNRGGPVCKRGWGGKFGGKKAKKKEKIFSGLAGETVRRIQF